MRALIFLLLFVSTVHAAQVITIPEGTTNFGPISVNAFDKWSDFIIDRSPTWTDENIKAAISLFASNDGGKTFEAQPFCGFTTQGTKIATPLSRITCPMPAGVTHIRGTLIVTGGSIAINKSPNMFTRQ